MDRIARLVAPFAAVALLTLGSVPPAIAQDPSPEPSRPVPMLDVALQLPLEVEFPTLLGDRPWQDVSIVSGAEMFAALDPDDPADAARISANRALLQATDKDLGELTSATGVRVEDDGSISVLNAYRIDGADPAVVRDVILARFADSYVDVMQEPIVGTAEIDGLEAIVVSDEALRDAAGNARSVYLIASGDTVWTVDVDDAFVVEAILAIPRDE